MPEHEALSVEAALSGRCSAEGCDEAPAIGHLCVGCWMGNNAKRFGEAASEIMSEQICRELCQELKETKR